MFVALALLVVVFSREGRAAVDVWDASTAYSHCYLIVPMTVYLLWERRESLGSHSLVSKPAWALAAIPITLFWLVAERLGVMEARQIAAVSGIQVLFLAVLGSSLYRAALGPLLFLFFAVPFGAFLTSTLQQFTAIFTVTGLELLAIPNYSDKYVIETPAGIFFVAEACAGLRFLVASVAFGVFYALLSYKTFARRGMFIAASIVIPIIANGFRALGIVVLGQVLGSAEAAAADHVLYGWLFFSIVMLALIAVGQIFREEGPIDTVATESVHGGSTRLAAGAALATTVLVCVGPAIAAVINVQAAVPATVHDSAFIVPEGCVPAVDAEGARPNERHTTVVCNGMKFDLSVTLFSPRTTFSPLVSERRQITREIGAEDVAVVPVELRPEIGSWVVVQTTDPNRVTAYANWINGEPSSGGVAGRIAQARNSIFGSVFAPGLLTVTTVEPLQTTPDARKAAVNAVTAFLNAQTNLSDRVAALTRNGVTSEHSAR